MLGKRLAPATIKAAWWLLGDMLVDAEVDQYTDRDSADPATGSCGGCIS